MGGTCGASEHSLRKPGEQETSNIKPAANQKKQTGDIKTKLTKRSQTTQPLLETLTSENGMQDEATAEIIIAHDKRYTDLHKTFSAAAHAPPHLADGAAPSSKFSFYHFFRPRSFFLFSSQSLFSTNNVSHLSFFCLLDSKLIHYYSMMD